MAKRGRPVSAQALEAAAGVKRRSIAELSPDEIRNQALGRLWKDAAEAKSAEERARAVLALADASKTMPNLPAGMGRTLIGRLWNEANDPEVSAAKRSRASRKMNELARILPVEAGAPFTGRSEGERQLEIVLTGTSARRIAVRIGVTPSSVGDWLNGTRPGSDSRVRLHRAFEIPIKSWDEPERPPPPKAPAEVLAELQLSRGFHHFAMHCGEGYPFTSAQSALAKVCFDGVQPRDLDGEEREVAREIFGPIDEVADSARGTVAIEAGRLSGKTSITARYVAYRCLTADLSEMFKSAVPAFAILAPHLRTSSMLFDQVVTFLNDVPAVKERIKISNSEEIVFDRPTDGRTIAVRTYPRSPAGREVRGQDFVGFAVDEAQFGEKSRGDSIITDADQIEAARPRLRGLEILLSSLWAAPSYMRDVIEQNWKRPTTALVVRGKTLTMRRGGAGYEKVAEERARELADPVKADAARREFDLIADDAETLFYEASLVDAAIEANLGEATGQNVSAGVDLGFRLDNSALIITERQGGRVVVVGAYYRKPEKGRALDPEVVTKEFAEIARKHGAMYVCADNHCSDQTERACRAAGIVAIVIDRTQLTPAADQTRTLLVQHRLAIPHPGETRPELVGGITLARELKSIRSKPGPGGTTEFLKPRVAGAGHCDAASALEMAVYDDARRYGPFTTAPVRPQASASFGAVKTHFDGPSLSVSRRMNGWMR